ncbi:MAG: hypothetical protein Q8S31_02360 [Alphaproteobacteria bacterium]|nr:hypothetical protein [Alphaproteobacteria bacterium]
MKKFFFPLVYLSLCGPLVSASPLENKITKNFNNNISGYQEHFDNVSNYVNNELFSTTSKWHTNEIKEYINLLSQMNEEEFETLKLNILYFATSCCCMHSFSYTKFKKITFLLHTKPEEFDDLLEYKNQHDISTSDFLPLFYEKMEDNKASDQLLLTDLKTNNEQTSDQLSLTNHKVNNENHSDQLPLTDHKVNNEKFFDDLCKQITASQTKEIVRCTFQKEPFNKKSRKTIHTLLLNFIKSRDFIELDDFDLSKFKALFGPNEQYRNSPNCCQYVINAMRNTHKLFNQQPILLSIYQDILELFFKLQNNSNEVFAFLSNTHLKGNLCVSLSNIETQINTMINAEKLKNIESWEPVFRKINVYNLDQQLFNELFEFIYAHSTPSQHLIAYLELINKNTSTKITNNFLVKTIIKCDENQLRNAHHQLKNICSSTNLDFNSHQLIAAYILLAQDSFEIAQQLETYLLNNPQQLIEAMKDIHKSFQKNGASVICYKNALKLLIKTEKPTDISLFLTCTNYNKASISFDDLENLIEKNINTRDLKNIQSWKQVFQLLDMYCLPENLFNNFLDFASLYSEPPRSLVYYLKLICRGTKNKITNISLVKTIMKVNQYGEASAKLKDILYLLKDISLYENSGIIKYFGFLNQYEENMYYKAHSKLTDLYSSALIPNEIKENLLRYIHISIEYGRNDSELCCLGALRAQHLYKTIEPYDLLKEHASVTQKRLHDNAIYNIKNLRNIIYDLSFSSLQSIANTILLAQESPELQKRLNYTIEKLPFYSLMNENKVKVNLRQHLNFVFQNKIPEPRKKYKFKLKKYLNFILNMTEETFNLLIVDNNKDFNDFRNH